MALSCPTVAPHGTYIRLLIDQGLATEIDLFFDVTAGKFRGVSGAKGKLRSQGWDRKRDPEWMRGNTRTYTGRSLSSGFQGVPPYMFEGRLILTEAEYYDLEAMWLIQQEDMSKDILLYDHRFMLRERTQTRIPFDVGSVAPYVSAGTVAYWAQFNTELKEPVLQDEAVTPKGLRYLVDVELHENYR